MNHRFAVHALCAASALALAPAPSAQTLCTAITVTASPSKTIAPSANFTRDGGAAFAYVQGSTPGCTWTATTDVAWVTFPDGANGAGSGWLRFAVGPTASTRQGTISINANQIRAFTVLQTNQTPHGNGTMQSPAGWTASPSTASVAQPFRISGYAIDERSTIGTGISTVDIIWRDNTGDHPLGTATYGVPHPHVAESLGSRFENSGYELEITGIPTSGTLPPGAGVSIQAFAHSSVDGSLLAAGATRVTVTAPTLTVSPSTLQFGAASTSGAVTARTGAQSIGLSGFGWTSGWTATTTAAWLQLSATSGTGPGRIDVSINSSLVPASGMLIGDIQISVPGVPAGLVAVPVRVDAYSGAITASPFGSFDPPPSPTSGAVPLTGWALDDVGVAGVSIYRNRGIGESGSGLVFIGDATFVDGARPDVANTYPASPQKTRAGWGYMLLSNVLPGVGTETWTVYAYATDVEGRQTLLGVRNVALANQAAEAPFGALDRPGPGDVVSGTYSIAGWAVSPQPGQITRVIVYLDGQQIGPVLYGIARPDVAALFGGPSGPVDASTPGFQFTIDTRGLANGLHTIAVVAFSNISSAAGLGSRYFVVNNP